MSGIKLPVENGKVMHMPDGIFNYFAWPSVIRNADGELLAVASGFRLEHVCPFGKVAMARSKDEGKTWSQPEIIIDTPLDDRDAGIALFGDNKLIVTSFNNTRQMQRSQDYHTPKIKAMIDAYLDLVTDEQEKAYLGSTYRLSEDGGSKWGPVLKAPVSAPHGPSVMNDGSLLYIGTCISEKRDDDKPIVRAYHIIDGINWQMLGEISYNDEAINNNYVYCEPYGIQLPDGEIILHMRVQTPYTKEGVRIFTVMQSVSTDGGHTWSELVRLIEHGAPPHILRHSSGVLISAYGYRLEPFGQRVMLSYDNAKTWETDYILRDDGPTLDLGYPCSVELKDGSILTIYYQQNESEKPCSILYSRWNLPHK